VKVVRNDALDVAGIRALRPSHIMISPGPGTPDDAGVSLAVLRELAGEVPVFGVCLGHQAIGQAFGGRVVRAPEPMHGKTSAITHTGTDILAGLPSPFTATRYHSLIVDRDTMPDVLVPTAWTSDGIVMAMHHRTLPIYGVQFHPESIASEHGHDLLANFLAIARGSNTPARAA
jgi:anthranilate synthase/aminodeoxychorismate synthase-like glutamine amidotransferase